MPKKFKTKIQRVMSKVARGKKLSSADRKTLSWVLERTKRMGR